MKKMEKKESRIRSVLIWKIQIILFALAENKSTYFIFIKSNTKWYNRKWTL